MCLYLKNILSFVHNNTTLSLSIFLTTDTVTPFTDEPIFVMLRFYFWNSRFQVRYPLREPRASPGTPSKDLGCRLRFARVDWSFSLHLWVNYGQDKHCTSFLRPSKGEGKEKNYDSAHKLDKEHSLLFSFAPSIPSWEGFILFRQIRTGRSRRQVWWAISRYLSQYFSVLHLHLLF